MTGGKINNLLIPNVSKRPGQKDVDLTDKLEGARSSDEFKKFLRKETTEVKVPGNELKLSAHAAKRLQERNLEMDGEEFVKLNNALEKLRTKGGKDSLVITSRAAYVVDVGNNMIVTAVDKNNMAENVFTKIDSTLIVD